MDLGDFIDKIIHGNALDVLKQLPDNSIDAVVTDPPYGLKFMNKKWDYDVPSVELWQEVFRVMKPGAHLLSFFGTRTYHRGVVNIEDAGFEIRDMIQWLYGEGFPKNMDVSKAIDKEFGKLDEREVVEYSNEGAKSNSLYNLGIDGKIFFPITAPATPEAQKWNGWGTALKPACEPIVLARKPISEKNIARNVLKWRTGGLNIDECRIGNEKHKVNVNDFTNIHSNKYGSGAEIKTLGYREVKGRFPANVILDKEAAKMLDNQSGITISRGGSASLGAFRKGIIYGKGKDIKWKDTTGYLDKGGASRFFYIAKANKKERWGYCHYCQKPIKATDIDKHIHDAVEKFGNKYHYLEFHPTVKPLKLIKYLVRLVTPKGGIVLDPFIGTGTTAIACRLQGYHFVGIDNNEIYCKIAEARLKEFPVKLDKWAKII